MRFLFGLFIFFLSVGFFSVLINPPVAVLLGLICGWYAGSN